MMPTEEEMRVANLRGCRFYPRCSYRMDRCAKEIPPLYPVDGAEHMAACYLCEK